MPASSLPFRFDAEEHTYVDAGTGEELTHITSMLARTGWVDDAWMTEESSVRGRRVHQLTADYDLGVDRECAAAVLYGHQGYLLAHIAAMRSIAHHWDAIEVPLVHPQYRFGGRPDRVGTALGLRSVLEVKSGQPQKGHQIQTALQAILVAAEGGLPADHYQRLALYLKPTGKFKLEIFKDRRDFDEARRIIRKCCGA